MSWQDPYTFASTVKEVYETLYSSFPTLFRFGTNALVQDTAEVRVVVHVDTSVGLEQEHLYAGLEQDPLMVEEPYSYAEDMPRTFAYLGFVVVLSIFGPPSILFSRKEGQYVRLGLIDRIATAAFKSQTGPLNLKWLDCEYPQSDWSAAPVQFNRFDLRVLLRYPMIDTTTVVAVETAIVEGYDASVTND